MSTAKKIAVVALAFVMVFVALPSAKGTTTSDLQAQIAALLAQINALQAQLSATGGAATSSYTYTKDLTLGSKGDDVTALQGMLISGGFLKITAPTGYFGPMTKSALAAWQASVGISPAAGYFGPKTRAYVASLPVSGGGGAAAGGGATSTPPVSGAPLTVTLASDTPSGGNILAGSANNTVAKIVFTAGNDADAKVTGLTIKSYGTAALNASDISRVKVFDGVTQVGLSQTQINGISTFTFAPAISITKGTSKVLSVVVDINTVNPGVAGFASPSATVKMGIESAVKVIGATYGGTFPLIGNAFTIVAGGSIGQLTVTAGAPVAVNNSYVGATSVVLGNYVVTAGTNEDVNVTQFNVSYGASAAATIQDTDLTNLRLQVDGVAVGTPASFSTRRATIDLSASPILLTKGSSKIFTVIGDIASGALHVIELDNNVNAVSGLGVTSGVGVTGGGVNNVTIALGPVNRITIGAGILSISVSNTSPAGQSALVVRSITQQVLGVYDVRAVGEDVLVNTVALSLSDAANDFGGATVSVSNVGLYDEAGALLSNQLSYTNVQMAANTGQAFALNWLIPANTTKKLYIKGTSNTLTATAAPANAGPNVIAVTLRNNVAGVVPAGNSVVGTGMSSSGLQGPNNVFTATQLALPALTVNATATYLAVPDPTVSIYNQAVIAPAAQVTLGYLKITAQNEDQTYRRVQLTPNVVGGGNLSNIASGVALFDGTTQVTNFVAPLAAATPLVGSNCIVATAGGGNVLAGDVCFATSDTITPTTFTLNVAKPLKIVANVLVANSEGRTFNWVIPPLGLETLGKSSGQVSNNVGPINLLSNAGFYNATGVYGVRTNVVEVTKDVASPSGNVRGTLVNHGIWDLNLSGTANTADVGSITFTSKVGLPNVAGHLPTTAMFKLYDYVNSIIIANAARVDVAAGTVTFNLPAAALTITRGTTSKIALQVTTTDVAAWPINTSLQWSIRSRGDITIGPMNTAVALGNADNANLGVLAAEAAGSLIRYTGATPFNYGTDGLYFDADNSASITAGDIRLAIGNAVGSGLGYGAGSVVVLADTDQAAPIAFAAIASDANLTKTGAAGAAFIPGTDAIYENVGVVANIDIGDIRVVPGNSPLTGLNWAAGVGYGGVTWSLPADTNSVTLP